MDCQVSTTDGVKIYVHDILVCVNLELAELVGHEVKEYPFRKGHKLYVVRYCATCFDKTTDVCNIADNWTIKGCRTYLNFMAYHHKTEINYRHRDYKLIRTIMNEIETWFTNETLRRGSDVMQSRDGHLYYLLNKRFNEKNMDIKLLKHINYMNKINA